MLPFNFYFVFWLVQDAKNCSEGFVLQLQLPTQCKRQFQMGLSYRAQEMNALAQLFPLLTAEQVKPQKQAHMPHYNRALIYRKKGGGAYCKFGSTSTTNKIKSWTLMIHLRLTLAYL